MLLPETMLVSKSYTDAGDQIFEWPVLPPGAIVTSWPGLLLRAMCESMVLLQLGSVPISVTLVTTKGHVDVSSLRP